MTTTRPHKNEVCKCSACVQWDQQKLVVLDNAEYLEMLRVHNEDVAAHPWKTELRTKADQRRIDRSCVRIDRVREQLLLQSGMYVQ